MYNMHSERKVELKLKLRSKLYGTDLNFMAQTSPVLRDSALNIKCTWQSAVLKIQVTPSSPLESKSWEVCGLSSLHWTRSYSALWQQWDDTTRNTGLPFNVNGWSPSPVKVSVTAANCSGASIFALAMIQQEGLKPLVDYLQHNFPLR